MIILNFNAFISILALTGYVFSRVLGARNEMLVLPRGDAFITFLTALSVLSFFLIYIWKKRGLVKSYAPTRFPKVIKLGHILLGIGNCILLIGMGFFWVVGSASRENEYWFGVFLTLVIGPTGFAFAVIGLLIVLLFPFRGAPWNRAE